MQIILKKVKDLKTNPLQPRKFFDREKLKELAQSIKESGLLQPIVIDEKNRIIAGERRWRAFMLLKKEEISCVVLEGQGDTKKLEKSIIENIQREGLTSIERENIVTDLWESGRYKNIKELSDKLGYQGDQTVSNIIKAKKDRKEFLVGPSVSSDTILSTRGLSKQERSDLLKRAEEERIGERTMREIVKFKKMQHPERKFQGKTKITSESKEKYIYGKLAQSLNSIAMLSIGWIKERVKLIDKYATPKEKREIVRAVESLVKKWTEILKALKS